ncbi:MAG TPA: hypothetical protein VF200_09950 [Woeseiaceae bacterium]
MWASYAVPLMVAVTGHRDLVPAEIPAIRDRIRRFLAALSSEDPDRRVRLMSGLAEGADRLVADAALEVGIPIVATLPMPAAVYREDFVTAESLAEFERLCRAAEEIFELPIVPGSSPESLAANSRERARQYAQLGVFLSAHCHILVALWDGKPTDQLGGTADVVRFHHDDVMPGYTPPATVSRLVLAEDESDLVYHIVCSRARENGAPAEGLAALDCWWFTADDREPRTRAIPLRHRRVFQLTREFNRDALRYGARIAAESRPLAGDSDGEVPRGARVIEHGFRIADWLALHYQKGRLLALRSTHVLALLMGIMYVVYSDVLPQRIFIVAFVGFFLIAAAVHVFVGRHAWHRKYLDYRTLAEGLRVQFYWAVAGVTSGTVSKFVHDNFLQMRDPDLGWIRNVMRVAGTRSDFSPNTDPRGLGYTIAHWIGDEINGQLGYFRRKSSERLRRHRLTERMALSVLWAGIIAVALFILAPPDLADAARNPVTVAMGILLLGLGVRQSYGHSTADAELTRQYEFMHRIFENAHRRLRRSEDDGERRRVLRTLGDAALEEHSEWILMHRERTTDQGDIWRMSS